MMSFIGISFSPSLLFSLVLPDHLVYACISLLAANTQSKWVERLADSEVKKYVKGKYVPKPPPSAEPTERKERKE